VGENRREEVDMKPLRKASGANFGWPIFEGTLRFRPGHIAHETKPVLQYPHTGGACAITGGVVIRDKRLRGLYGRYVYGDYCTGEIRTLAEEGAGGQGPGAECAARERASRLWGGRAKANVSRRPRQRAGIKDRPEVGKCVDLGRDR
jgi:hypothetical protein